MTLKAGEDAPDGEIHLYKLPSFSEKMCKKLMEIKFSKDDVRDLKHLIKLERVYEKFGKIRRFKKHNVPKEDLILSKVERPCASSVQQPITTVFLTRTFTHSCIETKTELAY
jgi:hypothetical protein